MTKTDLKENIAIIRQPLRAFCIFSLVILPVFSQQKSADIILIAPAYTMDPDRPWADAVVIAPASADFLARQPFIGFEVL